MNLFRKKTSSEIFVREINDNYKVAVKAALKQSLGDEFMAGVLVKSAIATTYDRLKNNEDLLLASALTEAEYQEFMERVCVKMLDKYLKSE